MARHHHIHVHLHDSWESTETETQDAGEFSEAKHKREGGKFSSTGGPGGGAAPVTGARAYAIKHTHRPAAAAKGAGPQSEEELAKQKASLL
jgi:hypothetical protein